MTRVPFFTVKSPMLRGSMERRGGGCSERHAIQHGGGGVMLATATGPSRALMCVPGVAKGHMGDENRGHGTDP